MLGRRSKTQCLSMISSSESNSGEAGSAALSEASDEASSEALDEDFSEVSCKASNARSKALSEAPSEARRAQLHHIEGPAIVCFVRRRRSFFHNLVIKHAQWYPTSPRRQRSDFSSNAHLFTLFHDPCTTLPSYCSFTMRFSLGFTLCAHSVQLPS